MTDEKEPGGIIKPETQPKPPGVEPEPPVPSEFLGRDKKRKKLEKQKRPTKTLVEEQIDAALAQSGVQAKRKGIRKKRIKHAVIGGTVCLLGYGIHLGLKPFEGGMAYGICRVFLENYVRYPTLLRLSTVEEFDTSVRIWYTQVDSFGEYRMEPIQCYYKQDPERGTLVDKILINRREIDRKLVDDFNRALPAISAAPLDLVMPDPLPDSLQDLQFNTDMFRKAIF